MEMKEKEIQGSQLWHCPSAMTLGEKEEMRVLKALSI
jgi:hypothetical protein